VSIGELQKALEAEVSAWWRQADLLDEQEDSEQATDDAASGVPAATGTRKRYGGPAGPGAAGQGDAHGTAR